MSKERITRAEFSALGKEVRRAHGSLFSLSVFERPRSTAPQFTCIVSKKVAARAVLRNAIKRRCRTAVRRHAKGLAPLALVFRAKQKAAHATFADIEHDVAMLVAELKR